MKVSALIYAIMIIVPATVMLGTAYSRLNALRREWMSKRWWVRRVGLLLSGVGAGGTIGSYFFTWAPYWYEIVKLCLFWGVALTWMTTPNQPPFWAHISKYDKEKNERREAAAMKKQETRS